MRRYRSVFVLIRRRHSSWRHLDNVVCWRVGSDTCRCSRTVPCVGRSGQQNQAKVYLAAPLVMDESRRLRRAFARWARKPSGSPFLEGITLAGMQREMAATCAAHASFHDKRLKFFIHLSYTNEFGGIWLSSLPPRQICSSTGSQEAR